MDYSGFKDIENYASFAKIKPIGHGWSNDKKYYVETINGQRLLLRVANIAEFDRKSDEFNMLKRVVQLNVPTSIPVGFGVCDAGTKVYQLLTWLDGDDAAAVVEYFNETDQYYLGRLSGEYLQRIHSITPLPERQDDWAILFSSKIDAKIKNYLSCELSFNGDTEVIKYLNDNRSLLENRPLCFQHGDYHVGNMLIEDSKTIKIIDWNRIGLGDPWEEFRHITWCVQRSPSFAIGQLHGYFDNEPPVSFWKLLALYVGCSMLSSTYRAIQYGQRQIDTIMKQSQEIMTWYDNFTKVVPKWYLGDKESDLIGQTR